MQGKRNNDHLFTVIMEFSGTTSASQVMAANPIQALRKWGRKLYKKDAYGLTEDQASNLLKEFDELEEVVLQKGLVNVWCTAIKAERDLALFHLIQTIRKQS